MAILLKSDDGKKMLIAGIVLLIIGMACAGFGISQSSKFKDMKEWPVIRAVITDVYEKYEKKDGIRTSAKEYTFSASFTMEENRITRVFTKRYNPGETVELIYNPRDPAEAYLASDPPESQDYYAYGGIAGLLGLALFCYAFEAKKHPKKRK